MSEELKDRLPHDPGDLLEVAIRELAAARANPRVAIDMCQWLLVNRFQGNESQSCTVCLAGSVAMGLFDIAKFKPEATTIEITPNWLAKCGQITFGDAYKLEALNKFRCGYLAGGLAIMVDDWRQEEDRDSVCRRAAARWADNLQNYSPLDTGAVLCDEPDFDPDDQQFENYLRALVAAWRLVPPVHQSAVVDLVAAKNGLAGGQVDDV